MRFSKDTVKPPGEALLFVPVDTAVRTSLDVIVPGERAPQGRTTADLTTTFERKLNDISMNTTSLPFSFLSFPHFS